MRSNRANLISDWSYFFFGARGSTDNLWKDRTTTEYSVLRIVLETDHCKELYWLLVMA